MDVLGAGAGFCFPAGFPGTEDSIPDVKARTRLRDHFEAALGIDRATGANFTHRRKWTAREVPEAPDLRGLDEPRPEPREEECLDRPRILI